MKMLICVLMTHVKDTKNRNNALKIVYIYFSKS